MTTQEIFNKAYIFIMKQGQKSIHYDGRCKYRGPDGTMCAVGCLIDDDATARAWDRRPSNQIEDIILQKNAKYLAPEWMEEHADLLAEMQKAHDFVRGSYGQAFQKHFHENMTKIAKRYELTVPQVGEIQ